MHTTVCTQSYNYSSEFGALIWAAQVDDTQSIIVRATAECFQFQICIGISDPPNSALQTIHVVSMIQYLFKAT